MAKVKQKLSNTLKMNFRYLKIIHFLHPCYHPKVIEDIFKNVTKNKCVCFNEFMANGDENEADGDENEADGDENEAENEK